MVFSVELLFQVLNTLLYILIPIAIYSLIIKFRARKRYMEYRIDALEERINDLEDRD